MNEDKFKSDLNIAKIDTLDTIKSLVNRKKQLDMLSSEIAMKIERYNELYDELDFLSSVEDARWLRKDDSNLSLKHNPEHLIHEKSS